MTERVELPNDNWAELRTEEEMTERHRRILRHALPASAKLQAKIEEIDGQRQMKARAEAAARGEAFLPSPDSESGALSFSDMGDFGPAEMDAIWDLRAAHIVAYVKSWSLGDPPTLETVIDIEAPYFDALAAATFDKPSGAIDTSPTAAADPDSPTEPSSDSSSDSLAPTGASDTSTPESQPTIASIGTVESAP
jgi:hypothetical protein